MNSCSQKTVSLGPYAVEIWAFFVFSLSGMCCMSQAEVLHNLYSTQWCEGLHNIYSTTESSWENDLDAFFPCVSFPWDTQFFALGCSSIIGTLRLPLFLLFIILSQKLSQNWCHIWAYSARLMYWSAGWRQGCHGSQWGSEGKNGSEGSVCFGQKWRSLGNTRSKSSAL